VLAFQRSSRVIRCVQASRNGTRVPRQPQVYKHWAGHLLPWAKPEPVESTWADQDHNIQADVAMLVESHFRLMRTKVASPCHLLATAAPLPPSSTKRNRLTSKSIRPS
jgi:hypothetical protein